jgi:peptide/nickel transport system ATP-binding protein
MTALLAVEGLTITLALPGGAARVVRDLDVALGAGETLGIVGGSGKSMTALALIGLLPALARAEGRIRFEGRDLLRLAEAEWVRLRGRRIAMVFQEPMTALNPVHRIGDQVAEPLTIHGVMGAGAARAEAARLLDRVGIVRARDRLGAYPHELSGGERQRVMIAMALACRPALLVADEPTSALDVTVQAALIRLLGDLTREDGMAMVVVSHSLAVVAALADRTLVLYGGMAMEAGPTRALLAGPVHPYSRGLLAALPRRGSAGARLAAIPGSVPPAAALPPGCPFFGRCPIGTALCRDTPPPTLAVGVATVRCHHVGGDR